MQIANTTLNDSTDAPPQGPPCMSCATIKEVNFLSQNNPFGEEIERNGLILGDANRHSSSLLRRFDRIKSKSINRSHLLATATSFCFFPTYKPHPIRRCSRNFSLPLPSFSWPHRLNPLLRMVPSLLRVPPIALEMRGRSCS